jgi:hypothetical protein
MANEWKKWNRTNRKRSNIFWVPQGFAGFLTYEGGGVRYIGTKGLAPCVALVLRAGMVGMVAHFDSDCENNAEEIGGRLLARMMGRGIEGCWVVRGTAKGPEPDSLVNSLSNACQVPAPNPQIVQSEGGDIYLDLQDKNLYDATFVLPDWAKAGTFKAKLADWIMARIIRQSDKYKLFYCDRYPLMPPLNANAIIRRAG